MVMSHDDAAARSSALTDELRAAGDRLLGVLEHARQVREESPEVLFRVLQETSTIVEELRVAEEALATQSELLEVYREELEVERSRYVDLFDWAPDGYVITDANGTILEANRAASELLGRPPSALLGKLLATFVAEENRRAFRLALARVNEGHELEEMVLPVRSGAGDTFEAAFTAAAGGSADRGVRWMIRDVSDRFAREAQIQSMHAEIELYNSLKAMAQMLVDDISQSTLLQRVTDLAAQAIPGAHAGITLRDAKGASTAAASDGLVASLDEIETELGEGPCMDAMRTGEISVVDDMATETRWPKFVVAAATRGIGSSIGVPLVVRDDVIGALNIYCERDHAFGASEVQLARMLADQAAVALANARLYESSSQLAEQLREALASRGLIEQAKGILMARERLGEDEAFDILRRASQRTNRKLRDIARQIVDSATTTASTTASTTATSASTAPDED